MKYSILFYEPASEFAKRDDAEQAGAYWGAWNAYMEALGQAGVMQGGAGLEPPTTATTIRLSNSQRHVQDGPYADTKEMLGGFVNIEVADLDAALEWAARSPSAASGATEVRPILPPPSAS